VEALLTSQQATLDDMAYLLVYVRDPHSFRAVEEIVANRFSRDIPVLFIEGSVCRPTWLIEMEGVAIIEDTTDFPAYF